MTASPANASTPPEKPPTTQQRLDALAAGTPTVIAAATAGATTSETPATPTPSQDEDESMFDRAWTIARAALLRKDRNT